jgi:hypothetical protein
MQSGIGFKSNVDWNFKDLRQAPPNEKHADLVGIKGRNW